MFKQNGRWPAIGAVIFSCLAVVSALCAGEAQQKKLSALQDAAEQALSSSFSTGGLRSGERGAPPGRLVVAVLWFENKTGDPKAAHWHYAIEGFVSGQLRHVKAVRLRTSGIKFAARQLGIAKGSTIGPEQAQKMGEMIEAHRVIWGSYTRKNNKWHVTAQLLNVATGKASDELVAASDDWFDVRDELTDKILKKLRITPTQEERKEMARRWTSSTQSLGWYIKAYVLQDENKPLSQQEASIRKAIAEDPNFARAHLVLAATLASQGKFPPAQDAIRQALKIGSDRSDAHLLLGGVLLLQKKTEQGEKELREAQRLDPDDAETLSLLGQFYAAQGKWDEAIHVFEQASSLEPMDPSSHAHLALSYARRGDRDKALEELKEAERLAVGGLEEINAEQLIWQAYVKLADIPLAVKHAERFVALAKKQGLNPELVAQMEQAANRLKATLTPTSIEASMPEVYTGQTLQSVLAKRLTENELEMVVNPVASSPEIQRWAQQLTEAAESDMDKAKALFDGLTRRIQTKGGRGTRTAQEVFDAWNDPNESFSCQEYAKLYLALAREVGVKAFYVHLEKDFRGKVVYHDCAAVFANGNALLVDPAYCWFGVPHKDFVLLDDVQTIAHHFFQHTRAARSVQRCRLAAKLHPDFAWGQLHLASALRSAEKPQEARKVLEAAAALEPGRWDAYRLEGFLAGDEGNYDAAATYLRKALELNSEDALSYYALGAAFLARGKLREAREQYRACLRYRPEVEIAEDTIRMIVQINEVIGVEESLEPIDVEGYHLRAGAASVAYKWRAFAYIQKEQYTAAIADCNKAIEINPQDPQTFAFRGDAYYRLDRHDLAIADCNQAIGLDPNLAIAYRTRGFARKAKRDFDGAIADFNKFQELASKQR